MPLPTTPVQFTPKVSPAGEIVALVGNDGRNFTRADQDAFRRLPDGPAWFEIHQVHYMVRNPTWRCDRLVTMGVLEKDTVRADVNPTVGIGFMYRTFYRKKVAATAPGSPQEDAAALLEASQSSGLAFGKTLAVSLLKQSAQREKS